eukprot:scaffold65289_cov33-Phaeocystis_antarctica.AAC.2
MADIFRCPDGATRGMLTVDWCSYHWIAVDAYFQTLGEEGSRKDEVAKKTAATPFRKGRFTFASLVWFINGKELRRAPTRAELLTLKPGDDVLLRHGISKNDPFGSYFAATPSFARLPRGQRALRVPRAGAPRACRRRRGRGARAHAALRPLGGRGVHALPARPGAQAAAHAGRGRAGGRSRELLRPLLPHLRRLRAPGGEGPALAHQAYAALAWRRVARGIRAAQQHRMVRVDV